MVLTGVVDGTLGDVDSGVAAVLAAGVAAALLVPGHGVPAGMRAGSLQSAGGREVALVPSGWWAPLALGAVVWLVGVGPVAGAVTTLAAVAVRRAVGSRRRARHAAESAGRALEACVVLADEVRAGHSAVSALELAAEVDPGLVPAYSAAVVGADVPSTLRALETSEYRFLAAAWQVSVRHGGGLADALERVVAQTRAERATERVVGSELASARATARLLVALPLFALLVGASSGGRPWEFLLHTVPGVLCLLLGGALAWAGLAWIDAIADGASGAAGEDGRT